MSKTKNNSSVNELSSRTKKIIIWSWWLITLGPLTGLLLVLFLVSFGDLPSFEELENPRSNEATIIYSSDGEILGNYFKENRVNVKFNQISKYMVDCLVATEDERFHEHAGIDYKALPRVFSGFIGGNTNKGGGSTLTQQLAKMLFHKRPDSKVARIKQKFAEWIIASRLERSYTKEEILTMYLNRFDFVNNAVGIFSASRVYFNTTPDSLRLEQAALLVGMCQNPSLYNPIRFPDRALKRREIILSQLLRNNENEKVGTKINREQYDSLRQLPLGINFQRVDHIDGLAPYFREELRKDVTDLLAQKDKNGNLIYQKKDGTAFDVYEDGLRIYTTIDSRMQKHAEWAVQEYIGTDLQKAFDKDNKRWKRPPFSNDIDEEKINEILTTAMQRSDRYKILAGKLCGSCGRTKHMTKESGNHICGHCQTSIPVISEEQILKVFNTKTEMRVFGWGKPNNEFDTSMSPMDSIRYYKHFLQAGLMAMEPQTGFIKAWVGGTNYKHFMYDHVRLGTRQVGSTFKPFVYAAAFRDRVFSPCNEAPDIEHCIEVPHTAKINKLWCPKNSVVGGYTGDMIPLYWAMANSMNNITAYIMKSEKPALVISLVKDLGIKNLEAVPAICLGVCDLSVYQMVGAQSAFANKGIYIKPIMFTRIEDRNGNVIYEVEPETNEAMDEYTAYAMLHIMKYVTSGVVNPNTGKVAGTGLRLRSNRPYAGFKNPIAGKTGTTQGNSDGWFIGLTPDLVTGVWVGAEDRSIRFSTTDQGQGANTSLPIWGYFMKKVYADPKLKVSQGDFEKPDGFPDEFINCRNSKNDIIDISKIKFKDVEENPFTIDGNSDNDTTKLF